jgi:hypothetical protein
LTAIPDMNIDRKRSESRGYPFYNTGYYGFQGIVPEAVMEAGIKEYVSTAAPYENVHYVNKHDSHHSGYMNILQTITDPHQKQRELNLHMYYI